MTWDKNWSKCLETRGQTIGSWLQHFSRAQECHEMFTSLDTDDNGQLSIEELLGGSDFLKPSRHVEDPKTWPMLGPVSLGLPSGRQTRILKVSQIYICLPAGIVRSTIRSFWRHWKSNIPATDEGFSTCWESAELEHTESEGRSVEPLLAFTAQGFQSLNSRWSWGLWIIFSRIKACPMTASNWACETAWFTAGSHLPVIQSW